MNDSVLKPKKYVDGEHKIVTFDVVDMITTSDSAEIPSTGDDENTMPSMGPNDTEVL